MGTELVAVSAARYDDDPREESGSSTGAALGGTEGGTGVMGSPLRIFCTLTEVGFFLSRAVDWLLTELTADTRTGAGV